MRTQYCKTLMSICGAALLLTGCARHETDPFDYTAFRASNPRSILVMPPINRSIDIKASNSTISQISEPLGEAGYYVLPVALTNNTFRSNGIVTPEDAQNIPPQKLHDIFGADAALYLTVDKYGTSYTVLDSVTSVSIKAQLIDLRNGISIWHGSAYVAESANQRNSSLLSRLIVSAIGQAIDSSRDHAHILARYAAEDLFFASEANILPGPRSPNYQGPKSVLDTTSQQQH